MAGDILTIDGSYLEGGGQIVRTAIALSAVLNQPVKIINIRKGRKPPGLKNQHLVGIKVVKEITNAKVVGLKLGSLELEFYPKKIDVKDMRIDIGTAGSIPLLLQTILLPFLFGDKSVRLEIIGGTDVKHSPTIFFTKEVVFGNLSKIGVNVNLEIVRHGFYPRGGGITNIYIKPWKERKKYDFIGEYEISKAICYAVSSKNLKNRRVNERELDLIENLLKRYLRVENIEKISRYDDTLSPGNSLTAIIETNIAKIGADSLGERGKKAEEVAEDCFKKLKEELENKAVIDRHTADHLIPFLPFCGGSLKTSEFTNHLLTNIWVVEQFFGNIFKIDERKKIIKCKKAW